MPTNDSLASGASLNEEVVTAMMACIQRNPFSEVAARLKWSTTSQCEHLLGAIRQRLAAELADWSPTTSVASTNGTTDSTTTTAMASYGEGAPVSRFLRPPNFKELPMMMAHTVPGGAPPPPMTTSPQAEVPPTTGVDIAAVGQPPQRDAVAVAPHTDSAGEPPVHVVPQSFPGHPLLSHETAQDATDTGGGGGASSTAMPPPSGFASLRQALRGAKLAAAVVASASAVSSTTIVNNEREAYPVSGQVTKSTAFSHTGHGGEGDDVVDDEMNTHERKRSRNDDSGRLDVDDDVVDNEPVADDDDEETYDVFIPEAVRAPPRKQARVEQAARRQSKPDLAAAAQDAEEGTAQPGEGATTAKHVSQMTKDEYMRQFKRAPRRGEIGITADDVSAATALGYVMSGSRNKSSEKYIDRIQRQLHEKQAAQLRLQFLQESDRRTEAAALQTFMDMLAPH